MKKYLISIMDLIYILKPKVELDEISPDEYVSLSYLYAEFLADEINISMFVPAIKINNKWNVLTKSDNNYKIAKENVLFENIEYLGNNIIKLQNGIIIDFNIKLKSYIEDLIKYNLSLTHKGLKLSYLEKIL